MNNARLQPSQVIHEKLTKAVNEAYGQEKIKIKKKAISPYDAKAINNNWNDLIKSTAVLGDLMNFTGCSVGDVDIYQLLQQYLTDDQKRKEINDIVNRR